MSAAEHGRTAPVHNAANVLPAVHHPVLIIGAGQAGLSVSWYLTRDQIPHAVFDRAGPLNGTQLIFSCLRGAGLVRTFPHATVS